MADRARHRDFVRWQGVSGRLVDNFFISNPIDVGRRLRRLDARRLDLRCICGRRFTRPTIGFRPRRRSSAPSSASGSASSPFASRLLNPYLNALNALPKVALAPLFVLWFGLGIDSKIALAAALVLFLVFLNTFAGVRQVDQDLIDGGAADARDSHPDHHQGHHAVRAVLAVCRACASRCLTR